MRSAAYIFLSICLSLTMVGCLTCHAMACFLASRVEVVDSQGEPVQSFSGSAIVEGHTYVFGCGGAEVPSVDGAEVIHHCFEGLVVIPFPEGSLPPVELSIESSEGLRFEGTIEPDYVVNDEFNGKGCGTCTAGSASVTLE